MSPHSSAGYRRFLDDQDKLFVGMGTLLVYLHRTSREVSSVVEHLLHTQGVAGSKPAPRTIPPLPRVWPDWTSA